VALLFHAFSARHKVRNYILLALLGLQCVQLALGAEGRWEPSRWGGPWFDIEVPQQLANEPSLYLTLGVQSNSFVAPYLAHASGFVNVSEGYALSADGANGRHIDGLMQKYAPHLRVLVRTGEPVPSAEQLRATSPEIDDALDRFGVRVDTSDCATITIHSLTPELEYRFLDAHATHGLADARYVLSCRLVKSNADLSALKARQRAVDLVFDRLEDACPELLQPRRMQSEHKGDVWRRLYANTDVRLWIRHGRVLLTTPSDAAARDESIFLGLESAWAKGPLPLACGRRSGRYIASLSP
jgi:hypothetical protein